VPEGRVGVEVDSETVERFARDLVAEEPEKSRVARERLIEIGPAALAAVMEHFPGRLLFDASGFQDSVPPVDEHSDLLAYLVAMDTDACEAVAKKLQDADPQVRYFAVSTLGRIRCEKEVDRLAGRLYDRDARVRLAAIEALQNHCSSPAYGNMLKDLRSRLSSDEPDQQAIAAALLGNFKDLEALPALVGLIRTGNEIVALAAEESLKYITKQEFGTNEKKWLKWWTQIKGQSRVQWLIEGLRSKNRDIRFSSAQELNQLTNEYFGYYFDSSKADREKAIKRWMQWWEEKGRSMRFD